MGEIAIIFAPTATKLPAEARGAVLVTGSHGGVYPGRLAAKAGARAAIFHDAGIGRDEAGIGSLALLEHMGIAAAAISHLSARVGDTDDMFLRGTISRANDVAMGCGVVSGMSCAEAAALLRAAPLVTADISPGAEGRSVSRPPGAAKNLVLVDSAALVDATADFQAVIVTGSHGGLVGGDPAMALRANGFAAAFNDAGIGIERAGIGRLAALDARGIAGITVAAASARIGEAGSTYDDGIISAVNEIATARGARVGLLARDVLLAWSRLE